MESHASCASQPTRLRPIGEPGPKEAATHSPLIPRANATVRPQVTLVFPSPEPGAFSLIVDGTATVHDDGVTVSPSSAVLHRPAIPIDGG